VGNHKTSDPDDHVAMVQPVAAAEIEDVIERMVAQGSTVTHADIVSADVHRAGRAGRGRLRPGGAGRVVRR
jgi:hypothetical protein